MITKRRLVWLALCIPLVLIAGCGEQSDNSDSNLTGVRADVSMVIEDAGVATPGQIDVVQSICDPGPPVVLEDFFDAQANVTFDTTNMGIAPTSPNLYIHSYEVYFTPVRTIDTNGNPQIPPDIPSYGFNQDIWLPPDGIVTESVIVVPVSVKIFMSTSAYWAVPTNIQAFYTITIVFRGESELGRDFDINVSTSTLWANYDTCS